MATEEGTKREHGMKRTRKDAIAERRIRRKESRRGDQNGGRCFERVRTIEGMKRRRVETTERQSLKDKKIPKKPKKEKR
jgi:hypothetical protein